MRRPLGFRRTDLARVHGRRGRWPVPARQLGQHFIAAGQLTLSYDLDVPAGDYRIEFYSGVQADPSGYGEGGQMLHAATVTHSGQGSQSFQTTFAFTSANWLTATATAIKSPNSYGNTSEFSLAIPANF